MIAGLVLAAHAAPDLRAQTAGALAPPVSLADLERRALEKHPALGQAQAAVEAARGRARQAGLVPNPIVGYTGEEINTGPTIRGGEHGFFVEQTIPLGGKLRLSRETFEREIVEADALVELQRRRILGTVQTLFYQALAAERRVEVMERLAQLATEAAGVSRQLFNVGAADRPDVLESDLEARRARIDLLAARNRRYALGRQLATAVGDPTLTLAALAGSIETMPPELDRETALQALLQRSPEVSGARAGVERARSAADRARREPAPDLIIRGGPRYNRELLETGPSGEPRAVGWEAAIEAGVSIPLFNRNQGGVAAADAEVVRLERDLRRLELALEARLSGAFDEYLTALRASEIYRAEILPLAEEAYALYLARYREMAAAYPQVLIAQRTLFQVNAQYLDTLERAWRAATGIQNFLVTEALDAPPLPGESAPGPSMSTSYGTGSVER
jgi:cobalt-zinc-cadmium efflux system outer membrane protein